MSLFSWGYVDQGERGHNVATHQAVVDRKDKVKSPRNIKSAKQQDPQELIRICARAATKISIIV